MSNCLGSSLMQLLLVTLWSVAQLVPVPVTEAQGKPASARENSIPPNESHAKTVSRELPPIQGQASGPIQTPEWHARNSWLEVEGMLVDGFIP